MPTYTSLLIRACLIIGPLLFATSTFFWTDGRYGATGGTLVAISMPFWTYGIISLLDRMRTVLPRYSATVLLLSLFGALGGAAFGFQGFFEEVYGVDHDASLAALDDYPQQAAILLWWLGPLFPATLFALGVGLLKTRQMPPAVAILICTGAILFPLSRIPRAEWIAHIVDLLLIIPFLIAAIRLRTQPAAPVF
jgi:hypothetical protein